MVEGPLLGGDLTVFSTLLGTRWLPDMTGAILLLEEVDEPPYRIDRVWTHLRNAGVLSRIAGIALGQFVECEPRDRRYGPHYLPRGPGRAGDRGRSCPASPTCPSATAT